MSFIKSVSFMCASLTVKVFQGGGRFQSLTDVQAFPAQSARLGLIRCAHSQSSCADCPLYRFGKPSR